MSDIVERLREVAMEKHQAAWGRIDGGQDLSIGAMLADEAADEIERLQAELREAHKFLAIQLDAIEAFGITGGASDEVRAFLAK